MQMHHLFCYDNTMKKDVVIIGASILDVLCVPASNDVFEVGSYSCDDITLSLGGDALNEAILLSKMNKSVELVTLLGNDDAGRFIQKKCIENKIILRNELRDDLKTGINVVLVKEDGSRHFLTNRNGTLRKLKLEDIVFPLSDASILCFASIFVFPFIKDDELTKIFKQAKSQNMTVVCDMTKCKNHEKVFDLRNCLKYIDYLIPNDEEILLFTGCDTVEEACTLLLEVGVKNIIVKCGSRGCYVCTADICSYVSTSVVECVDTTGAGDSFVSGFVCKLLESKSLNECVSFGNECGSKCVQKVGATTWIDVVE